MKLRVSLLLALGLPLAIAAAAPAVIIDSGDGTGNTSAPSPDPGWSHVGSCNGLSAVYLGDGWVLTANHVGPGNSYFENVLYPWAIGSDVRLHNPDNSYADLLLFRLQPPFPPLTDLVIASAAPPLGRSLVMIGNGRNRGDPYPPGPGPKDGYLWGSGAAKRWGTNYVEDVNAEFWGGPSQFNTKVFGSEFHKSGSGHSTHECHAATGDSGGAAFAWNGSSYDLAGILIGIVTYQSQPPESSFYGNYVFAADLFVYRDEIVATMPEPTGGLFAGIALLAMLANAGTRRACRGTGCAASSPPRA